MSLTLVELAQAIEDGKTIQIELAGEWNSHKSKADAFIWFYKGKETGEERVRIKPEPREFWLIPYTSKLGYKVCATHYSQWEPEVNVAGLNFAGIIHVGELL